MDSSSSFFSSFESRRRRASADGDSTGANLRGRTYSNVSPVSYPHESSSSEGVITVDLHEIGQRLQRLRGVAGEPISRLQGQLKEDHAVLVQYMKLLYGTDAYRVYHREVQAKFGDLATAKPGTVGAYFKGCVLASKIQNGECSALCAGSLPQPDQTPCVQSVVLATNNDRGGYDFKTLHKTQGADTLIVYLTNQSPFAGFSEEEKKQLAEYGAKTVIIRRNLPDGGYEELSKQAVTQLPSRVDVIPNATQLNTNSGGNSLMVLLLIILVILAIFIGWRVLSKRNAA